MNTDSVYLQELNRIRDKKLFRTLAIPQGIDFSSNDYLNLSVHPTIKNSLILGIQKYGAGSTGSRLIRGHRDIYDLAEKKFADWVRSESAIYLSSGYLANLGLIEVLADPRTTVFTDRLNHASILDGIRISGAKKKYYPHLNLSELERNLESIQGKKIIISETVFSMDGDVPDISKLIDLKIKHDAILILDEAHGIGVRGMEGRGEIFEQKLSDEKSKEIDFRIYTCGKAIGLEGAMIACSSIKREFLINKMRTFIFSTANLPAIPFALHHAIDLIRGMDLEREKIKELSRYTREKFQNKGYKISSGHIQILPILFEDEESVLNRGDKLKSAGFDIRPIRKPTVETPRLRICINSGIYIQDIDAMLTFF